MCSGRQIRYAPRDSIFLTRGAILYVDSSQRPAASAGAHPPGFLLSIEVKLELEVFVRRIVLALTVLGSVSTVLRAQAPADASLTPSEQILDAEALIVKSDWKGAEARLAPWLNEHPT